MRALAVLLLVISGCSTASPTPSPGETALAEGRPEQTWIGVHVEADWVPPQEMSLEVGDQAWSITVDGGPGVVSTLLSERSSVRLVGVENCHVYAAFHAAPGGFYSIRFIDDDSTSIMDVTVMEAGPGLVERDAGPTGCE